MGSFDGSFIKLYLDGVLVDSTDFSGTYEPDPATPLNVGIDSYDLDNAWKGTIDDLRVFNRVLSETEVKNSFDGAVYASDGLIGYWPFDNNTKDLSGKQNDANVASQAVSMAFSPDGRLFFTEKNIGDVRIMKDYRYYLSRSLRYLIFTLRNIRGYWDYNFIQVFDQSLCLRLLYFTRQ